MLSRLFGKKEKQKGSTSMMLMLLLPDLAQVEPDRIVEQLRQTFPSVRSSCGGKDKGHAFEVGGVSAVVGFMPAPVPGDEVERAARATTPWPEGQPTTHAAHALVVGMGADARSSATAASRLAAALSLCTTVIGWYVGCGFQVLPTDVAVEMATDEDGGLPTMIWVNVIASKDGADEWSLSTIGMEALGHAEFEIVRMHSDPEDWTFRLYDLCNYVLESGPVLKHGQTFGVDANEKIKIEEGKSKLGKNGRVIRLLVP